MTSSHSIRYRQWELNVLIDKMRHTNLSRANSRHPTSNQLHLTQTHLYKARLCLCHVCVSHFILVGGQHTLWCVLIHGIPLYSVWWIEWNLQTIWHKMMNYMSRDGWTRYMRRVSSNTRHKANVCNIRCLFVCSSKFVVRCVTAIARVPATLYLTRYIHRGVLVVGTYMYTLSI